MSFLSPGQVVWFEVGTTDPDAVTGFYGPLLGWRFEVDEDSSVDGRTYTRILAPGAPWPMGAIQQGDTDEEAINLSILSTDVHADVDRLTGLGASVLVPATQVADVTVFARLRDPLGNLFSLFSQSTSERFEERIAGTEEFMDRAAFVPQPGWMAWFEIGTSDVQVTIGFYSAAFGWRFDRDDTAGGRPYFNIFGPGAPWPSGGLWDHRSSDSGEPREQAGADYAMPCFLVTDLTGTVDAATRAGADIEYGPAANRDGLAYARLIDPRGNRFGLFSRPAQQANG